ncbi:hypothetical protein CLU81_4491 [Flavobacterium sp. 9]|nr:hypothetical protein CLU81_4491 [Flavobacterium sp. 9]
MLSLGLGLGKCWSGFYRKGAKFLCSGLCLVNAKFAKLCLVELPAILKMGIKFYRKGAKISCSGLRLVNAKFAKLYVELALRTLRKPLHLCGKMTPTKK